MASNQVKDLAPVASLTKLWSLYVDHNKIEAIGPVIKLSRLSSLDLRSNLLEDLSPLAGLTELKYLILDDNKIADLGILIAMAKKDLEGKKRFAPYWQIYLTGNPVKKEQLDELRKTARKVVYKKSKKSSDL